MFCRGVLRYAPTIFCLLSSPLLHFLNCLRPILFQVTLQQQSEVLTRIRAKLNGEQPPEAEQPAAQREAAQVA